MLHAPPVNLPVNVAPSMLIAIYVVYLSLWKKIYCFEDGRFLIRPHTD